MLSNNADFWAFYQDDYVTESCDFFFFFFCPSLPVLELYPLRQRLLDLDNR